MVCSGSGQVSGGQNYPLAYIELCLSRPFVIGSIQTANPPPDLLRDLRASLESAVKRNRAEAILLSGGLDTSIIATIACRHGPLRAYTVALEGAPAPDIEYAKLMTKRLGLKHKVHVFSLQEFMQTLPEVVKALRVFDPMEIRNSAAVYIAMKQAEKEGVPTFFTGDACDELFAGYSFLFNLDPSGLRTALERLWKVMSFSAIRLAKSLGMEAKIPFLDSEFKQLAMKVDPSLLVVEQDGRKWGKWIVRKAFEEDLPKEITWRVKTPIEYGCGTTTLPMMFEQRMTSKEFQGKQRRIKEEDHVTIRDKEHLAYYEVFRDVIGTDRGKSGGATCPQCNYSVPEDATFCKTCGAYPI